MTISHSNPVPKLIPVSLWNKYHLWPSVPGLRHLVAHAKEKHFEEAVVRAGGRVLINENAFFEWLTKENKKGGAI